MIDKKAITKRIEWLKSTGNLLATPSEDIAQHVIDANDKAIAERRQQLQDLDNEKRFKRNAQDNDKHVL